MDQKNIEDVCTGLCFTAIRYSNEIDSTNSEAARWIGEGAPDLAIVVADEQTAGRGRHGRKWFTPPGAALAFSVIMLDPFRSLSRSPKFIDVSSGLAQLTALGSLAVCQALRDTYNLDALIKWPNDVLINRMKTAGVLVEGNWYGNQFKSAILGIGVNISPQAVPYVNDLMYPATCVEAFVGRNISRTELLREILVRFCFWQEKLGEESFHQSWNNWLAFKGEWVDIITDFGDKNLITENGLVEGVDQKGRLRILEPSGEILSIEIGEIHLRPVA